MKLAAHLSREDNYLGKPSLIIGCYEINMMIIFFINIHLFELYMSTEMLRKVLIRAVGTMMKPTPTAHLSQICQ